MEQIRYKKDFESILTQCQKVVEQFEGSEETLNHIRRVEESLRNIIFETN